MEKHNNHLTEGSDGTREMLDQLKKIDLMDKSYWQIEEERMAAEKRAGGDEIDEPNEEELKRRDDDSRMNLEYQTRAAERFLKSIPDTFWQDEKAVRALLSDSDLINEVSSSLSDLAYQIYIRIPEAFKADAKNLDLLLNFFDTHQSVDVLKAEDIKAQQTEWEEIIKDEESFSLAHYGQDNFHYGRGKLNLVFCDLFLRKKKEVENEK